MFTMDTMEAPEPGTPGKDGEDEPSHNKLEDMIKELGTALTGKKSVLLWLLAKKSLSSVIYKETFQYTKNLFQESNMNKST